MTNPYALDPLPFPMSSLLTAPTTSYHCECGQLLTITGQCSYARCSLSDSPAQAAQREEDLIGEFQDEMAEAYLDDCDEGEDY